LAFFKVKTPPPERLRESLGIGKSKHLVVSSYSIFQPKTFFKKSAVFSASWEANSYQTIGFAFIKLSLPLLNLKF